MPKTTKGQRGRQGIPGPPGPAGHTGGAGQRGPRGAEGKRGPAGETGQRGKVLPSERRQLLSGLNQQLDHVYQELDTQMKRMAQIQLQLDGVREKLQRLV